MKFLSTPYLKLYEKLGDLKRAQSSAQEALEIFKRLGMKEQVVEIQKFIKQMENKLSELPE